MREIDYYRYCNVLSESSCLHHQVWSILRARCFITFHCSFDLLFHVTFFPFSYSPSSSTYHQLFTFSHSTLSSFFHLNRTLPLNHHSSVSWADALLTTHAFGQSSETAGESYDERHTENGTAWKEKHLK